MRSFALSVSRHVINLMSAKLWGFDIKYQRRCQKRNATLGVHVDKVQTYLDYSLFFTSPPTFFPASLSNISGFCSPNGRAPVSDSSAWSLDLPTLFLLQRSGKFIEFGQ